MSTGIFSYGPGYTPADLVNKSFASAFTKLFPNGGAPMYAISSRLPRETATQVEHGFFSKTMLFPQMVNGAATTLAAATTIPVVSTQNIIPSMVMEVETTREHLLVIAILSPTSVQVRRGVGVVAATDIPANANLFQVGSAHEEASIRPTALQINAVRIVNLTQIIRNTWAVSGSMAATQMIAGGENVAESRQECMTFHALDIERAAIWGQRAQGTLNGQQFRKMDGLIQTVSTLANYPPIYAATNVFAAGSTTNYTQLQNFLEPTLNQVTDASSGNQRLLFVGATAMRVINDIGRLSGQYQIENGQTDFGLQFRQFKTARGTFNMVEHPLFNSNASWARLALCVDIPTFRLAYLKGRDTEMKGFNSGSGGDAQDNGIDAEGGTITSELTAVFKNPPANAVINGFTAAA
jgi:hypothetical protein